MLLFKLSTVMKVVFNEGFELQSTDPMVSDRYSISRVFEYYHQSFAHQLLFARSYFRYRKASSFMVFNSAMFHHLNMKW